MSAKVKPSNAEVALIPADVPRLSAAVSDEISSSDINVQILLVDFITLPVRFLYIRVMKMHSLWPLSLQFLQKSRVYNAWLQPWALASRLQG